MVPRSTESPSVRELVTYGNHSPVDQAQNNGPSANSQEIMVSTENVRYEGTKDQSVTSPGEEALGRNYHVSHFKSIIKYPQRYNSGFGADREWNNEV